MEFVDFKIKEIAKVTAGGDKPKIVSNSYSNETPIPIYSNGMENDGLYGYTNIPKVDADTVTISARGVNVGKVCYRETAFLPIVRLLSLIPNRSVINAKYMYYNLKMMNISGTGSAQPQITVPMISELKMHIHKDLIEQEKIASFLSVLDEKIKNNNRINRNLLEQLDALYDNWFGKYKPFNIGIGGDPGYALEDGWQIRDIYSIAEVIYGAPFTSKKFNTEGKGKPIVRIRDLKNQELCTYTPEEHPKGYLLQPGDIVVGMDGEFRPYIWGNEEAWLNQRVCVFNNVRKNGKAYVYCTIKPLLYSVETTEVATTVIHIGKKDYDEFRVVLPPEDILVEFEAVSKPIFDRIVEGQLENRRLTKLRNGLLPKLMSGELDVSYLNV